MKKLAIVTSHPIQYNAPLFRLLHQRGQINIKVYYTWGQTQTGEKYDPGFGKHVDWDIPLLDGYDNCFVENISTDPGSHHFKGIINPSLVEDIRNWKPDSIMVFGWSFKSHLHCLRYFYKKLPVLFRGDSTLLDEAGGFKKMIRAMFLKWVYRHVDHALYVGTQNKLYYLRHGLNEDQLAFAPHAIDNDRFTDRTLIFSNEALLWRKTLQIREGDLVFLYAGKLEQKKDPAILIKAFEKVYHPTLHLIIVGNGTLEKELKQQYNGLKGLHFFDFQNQTLMPVIYYICDVFVLPSCGPGETWGLSVNEAMACGKPVIVSNKSGCAIDLVDEGQNGFTFNAGNINELSGKMNLFIRDRALSVSMGKKSLEMIKDWNYTAVADKIELWQNSLQYNTGKIRNLLS